MKFNVFGLLLFCFLVISVNAQNLSELNKDLTEQTVIDKLSPPLASRVIAYCNIAYYYGLHFNDVDDVILNQISKTRNIDMVNANLEVGDIDLEKFSARLFIEMAKNLAYNKTIWDTKYDTILNLTISELHFKILINNLQNLISNDGFKERNVHGFYSPKESKNSYELTPPTFSEPVEKNWEKIKPFFLENILELQLKNDLQNGIITEKKFFKQNKSIYKKSKKLKQEQEESALLWDCNPIRIDNIGHVKKVAYRMTPAAHWINILADIDTTENNELLSEQFTYLSMALFDAFIVVWKNKYDTDFIRPVTYINKNIDGNWSPYLDTPIFPEFPSGHSAVSIVAANVLSYYYGNKYSFLDNTQYKYSKVKKEFNSFREAALDAGYSRYYGGIHYMEAIEKGFIQGDQIFNAINIWEKE